MAHRVRAAAERAAGLSSEEAALRLARHGPNEIPRAAPPAPLGLLAAQMTHFFALMLWAAAALAMWAGMFTLGMAIGVVVLVNGVFAFFQEYRAGRAAERLKDLLPRRVTVRRDGRPRTLDARELVPGDVVRLAAGHRVSADLRLLEAHALAVDASTLTGESAAVHPGAGDEVLAGTFAVGGEAEAVVERTGRDTRLARIVELTRERRRPPTPLALELARLVRTVALMAVGVGLAFFLVGTLVGLPANEGFLFAIGVTVALVPEGLLPTITLSLAIGARRMAARHALVRRLESVETLGSVTFICTDKTGTLTQNEMGAVAVWTPAGEVAVTGRGYEPRAVVHGAPEAVARAARVAFVAARCSSGHAIEQDGRWLAEGDPMDAALWALAKRLAVEPAPGPGEPPVLRRFPFDPVRRRASVLVGDELFVKGAPDSILARCLDAEGAAAAVEVLAARGLRVIAVARGAGREARDRTADEAERGLELLGLVALEDPPRPGARRALELCRRAGIRVGMVTGDHPATALAIAREVGLVVGEPRLLRGSDLPDDDAVLGALLDRDGVVVCRVTPEDKLRIARVLQARGHVVAMTGDGVNDAPALQQADIGVAMGRSGTDVAREAADLVLLDDDFATVVAAIEQGRATFQNVRSALAYHLTDNVSELTPFIVWAISGARFPLALGVLQILLLDLVTDQLPALALGTEAPGKDALLLPPRRGRLLDAALFRRVFGVLGPAEALVEMLAFVGVFAAAGWRPGEPFEPSLLAAASGAAFTAVVLGQVGAGLACRSPLRSFHQLPANPRLVLASAFSVAVLLLLLFVPPLARALHHAAPTAWGATIAACALPAVLVADLLHKRLGGWRERAGVRPASA